MFFKRAVLVVLGMAVMCGTGLSLHTPRAAAQELSPQERQKLQAEYDQLLKEIEAQQAIIKETQAKKNTLQGDVTLLNAQIKAAQAEIDAKNIVIKQLGTQITKKNQVIGELTGRIERGKQSLGSILRQTQVIDDSSIIDVALGSQDVSDFFNDLDAFTSLKSKMADLFTEIRENKAQAETEKADLARKQDATLDAKFDVQTKQKQISTNKQQKQTLLAITANQEAEYKKVLAERQAKAAQIRAALFPLRDAQSISFGTALQYAQQAQNATGVPPALTLAILTQESNLGANVGQCYLTNDATGAGVGKNSGAPFAKVMAPSRDVPVFLQLAQDLGFDSHHQVVSCPIASAGGWGGAMGPAQFIPSTWKLYAARVASANGKAIANPWDPKDAITAMSYLLADNGASAGTYTAQYNAAARYYAGWSGPSTRAGQTYASQVMAKVASLQSNIDFLADN